MVTDRARNGMCGFALAPQEHTRVQMLQRETQRAESFAEKNVDATAGNGGRSGTRRLCHTSPSIAKLQLHNFILTPKKLLCELK
jgi:hypothetical protein